MWRNIIICLMLGVIQRHDCSIMNNNFLHFLLTREERFILLEYFFYSVQWRSVFYLPPVGPTKNLPPHSSFFLQFLLELYFNKDDHRRKKTKIKGNFRPLTLLFCTHEIFGDFWQFFSTGLLKDPTKIQLCHNYWF